MSYLNASWGSLDKKTAALVWTAACQTCETLEYRRGTKHTLIHLEHLNKSHTGSPINSTHNRRIRPGRQRDKHN